MVNHLNRSPFDPFTFFSDYPRFVCALISIYYPLPVEWLRKFGDILIWGQVVNADDMFSAPRDFYEAGIIFNRAINWNDEVSALVFANLANKGGDLEIRYRFPELQSNVETTEKTISPDSLKRIQRLVEFTRDCPLGIDEVINSHANSIHVHYINEFYDVYDCTYEDFEEFAKAYPDYWSSRNFDACREMVLSEYDPTIKRKLSISEIIKMSPDFSDSIFLLKNPDLWHLTLSELFTEDVTKQLLCFFYHKHMWKSDLPF